MDVGRNRESTTIEYHGVPVLRVYGIARMDVRE